MIAGVFGNLAFFIFRSVEEEMLNMVGFFESIGAEQKRGLEEESVEHRRGGSISTAPTTTIDVWIRRVMFWKGL